MFSFLEKDSSVTCPSGTDCLLGICTQQYCDRTVESVAILIRIIKGFCAGLEIAGLLNLLLKDGIHSYY